MQYYGLCMYLFTYARNSKDARDPHPKFINLTDHPLLCKD